MMNPLYNKIEIAKLTIMVTDSDLGKLLNHFPISLRKDIETAATNGRDIFFGEAFLKELSNRDVIFILLHELLHILLNHLNRKGDRDHQRFNIACDIVVNNLLTERNITYDTLKPVHGHGFQIYGGYKSVEAVYDKLKETVTYEKVDNHHLWDSLSDNEKVDVSKIIEDASYHHSSLIEEIKRQYSSNKVKPTLIHYLKPYLSTHESDYHYQKTDPRYQDVLFPYYSQIDPSIQNLWIVIDVSGSMTKELLDAIFNQLVELWRMYPDTHFQMSFFSLHLTPPKEIRSIHQLKEALNDISSSMGTDMAIIFKNYKSLFRIKPIANIIITDGYGESPSRSLDPKVPTAWVLTEDSLFKPHFGQVVQWEGLNAS